MSLAAVTQIGLPFCDRSLLPGPQPTSRIVVRLSSGTSEKPQSWTLFALGFAPTASTTKKFCVLWNRAPEFCGTWYCTTPPAATATEAVPTSVLIATAIGFVFAL